MYMDTNIYVYVVRRTAAITKNMPISTLFAST